MDEQCKICEHYFPGEQLLKTLPKDVTKAIINHCVDCSRDIIAFLRESGCLGCLDLANQYESFVDQSISTADQGEWNLRPIEKIVPHKDGCPLESA